MTLTINLAPEDETKLKARAAANGQDAASFVQALVQREIEKPLSFDVICAPLRREVEASGITDDALDALLQEAREDVWREKQTQRNPAS